MSEFNVKKTNEKIRGFYEENEELKEKVSSFEEDLLACEQREYSNIGPDIRLCY